MQLYKTYKVNRLAALSPHRRADPVFLGLSNSPELHRAAMPPSSNTCPSHITWLTDSFPQRTVLYHASAHGRLHVHSSSASRPPPAIPPTEEGRPVFMPVIFTVMFINFPAGLVIYWLCNNILSIGRDGGCCVDIAGLRERGSHG